MMSYLTCDTVLGASLPEAVYQYLVSILLPVTDNLLSLNQRKRESVCL